MLSCWWKEYAECSEGPKGAPDLLSPASEKSSSESSQLGEEYSVEEERVGVPVKGGLYEVSFVHTFTVCVCVHEQLLLFISPSRESTFWTGIMTCERKKRTCCSEEYRPTKRREIR